MLLRCTYGHDYISKYYLSKWGVINLDPLEIGRLRRLKLVRSISEKSLAKLSMILRFYH